MNREELASMAFEPFEFTEPNEDIWEHWSKRFDELLETLKLATITLRMTKPELISRLRKAPDAFSAVENTMVTGMSDLERIADLLEAANIRNAIAYANTLSDREWDRKLDESAKVREAHYGSDAPSSRTTPKTHGRKKGKQRIPRSKKREDAQ